MRRRRTRRRMGRGRMSEHTQTRKSTHAGCVMDLLASYFLRFGLLRFFVFDA